jgi:hypothetical protein
LRTFGARGFVLRHYCRDFTWAIRPPRGIQDLCLAIGKAREQLHDAIGREPTVDALTERLDRTPDEIIAALAAEQARALESLDAAIDPDDSGFACTGDLTGNNDEEYERVEARATVERLTSILDARAREKSYAWAARTTSTRRRSPRAWDSRRCTCLASRARRTTGSPPIAAERAPSSPRNCRRRGDANRRSE